MNLSRKIVENNVPILNSRLKDFISRYIIPSNGLTPAQSSLGQGPALTTQRLAVPAVDVTVPTQQPQNVPETFAAHNRIRPVMRPEYFSQVPRSTKANSTGIMRILLFILVIVVALYLLHKNGITLGNITF